MTFGHKIGRDSLERKKRKTVIRNHPLPLSTPLLGAIIQFCLWSQKK